MTWFQLTSVLVVLAALFSYFNYRYIRLPTTIGVMLIALVLSLAVILIGSTPWGAHFRSEAARVVVQVDFNQALLHGMLSLLLFAGALHVDAGEMGREWLPVLVLSTIGTALSTFIVAGLMFAALHAVGLPGVPFSACVLFGTLISPTDPISVLGIMKRVGAPKRLEALLAGESLFNDGVGAVFFMVTLEALAGTHGPSVRGVATLLAQEALGGVVIGWAVGWVTNRLMGRVDNYQVEVLLTLAAAMGGYALMDRVHVSAPIGIVVAGLVVGRRTRGGAAVPVVSEKTREHLETFWELIDEIMNAVLFLMIGLVVLVMPFLGRYWAAALLAVNVTLLARWLSTGSLVGLMSLRREFDRGATTVLTWGGLRGGISVALALSIPAGRDDRYLIVAITYGVVVFSVFVQGLTVGRVIAWTQKPGRGRLRAADVNARGRVGT